MGSHCSKVKQTAVIWPVAVTPDNTTPGSLEGLDKIPYDDHSGEKKPSKHKKKDNCDTKTREIEDGDGIRESHDTNVTRDRMSDDSGSRRAIQYQKGPALDSNSGFAEVCECLDLNLGERLAIKTYKAYGTMDKLRGELELLQDEITILQDLYHENLIRYDGMEFHEVNGEQMIEIDIIMEYASGGSVWGLIQKFSNLEERVVQNYTRQMLEGLAYLHSEGVVHGNLKGSNVLIDSNGVIKLTDIQSANRIKYFSQKRIQGNDEVNILIDSIYWTAPEVLINKKIEAPADVWSVGCVVLEMLTGLPPWQSRGREEAEKRIICGCKYSHNDVLNEMLSDLPPVPEDISETCKDFLTKVFKYNPEERPSMQELLEHPFVQLGTEKSSTMSEGGLQSLQSFNSVFRANTGNTGLISLNSLNPNTPDAQPFDQQTKYNIAINVANPNQMLNGKGNKSSPGRPKKSPSKKNFDVLSKDGSNKHLPHVEETNIEEEEASPNEKLYRKRRSAEFKKDWAGLQVVSMEEQNRNQGGDGFLKPGEFNVRKSKTEEYQGATEQNTEKVDLDKDLLPQDNMDDDNEKQEAEQASKKPFAPTKVSLFKKIARGEAEENENLTYRIKEIKDTTSRDNNYEISPSLSSSPSKPSEDNSPTLTKEEQRKRIEQEIMDQLMRINSKDLSQDFSASFEALSRREEEEGQKSDNKKQEELRKKFAEELKRQLMSQQAQEMWNKSGIQMVESVKFVSAIKEKQGEHLTVNSLEEQRKRFEEDLRKQLLRINTGELLNLSQSLGRNDTPVPDEKELKESNETKSSKESKGL